MAVGEGGLVVLSVYEAAPGRLTLRRLALSPRCTMTRFRREALSDQLVPSSALQSPSCQLARRNSRDRLSRARALRSQARL